MSWKSILVLAVVGAGALAPLVSQSQQPARTDQKNPAAATTKAADPRTKDADARAREIAALRASAQTFIDAFNRGDAKAVAALWTKDGEYIDELGQRFEGREAIEKEYASFFATHSGAKVTVAVDSLRLAGDTTAIEDGRVTLQLGQAPGGGSGRYTAIHVKTDGKWLMSSVRDARVESSSPARQLHDLQWLAGTWAAEDDGARMEVTCLWIADKSFLERRYSVKRADQILSSGLQVIGWNPQAGRIQSWNFTSDGGHATGLWSPQHDGWAIETTGMHADGTPTQAVNVFTRLDDGAVSWKSIERSAGGTPLADTEDVLLRRTAQKN